MRLVVFLFTLFISVSVMSNDIYGSKITLDKIISIENALKKADGKTEVLVEASVEKVCKNKGCWMTLKIPNDDLRVTFKNYGFFVPISLEGKKVKVQGSVHKKELSLTETKHYVMDAGGDPNQITEAITEYRIIASGVATLD